MTEGKLLSKPQKKIISNTAVSYTDEEKRKFQKAMKVIQERISGKNIGKMGDDLAELDMLDVFIVEEMGKAGFDVYVAEWQAVQFGQDLGGMGGSYIYSPVIVPIGRTSTSGQAYDKALADEGHDWERREYDAKKTSVEELKKEGIAELQD